MRPKVIGLTGGIGAGKSTVANIFKVLGIPVFDSDSVAKNAYFDQEVKKKIIDLLGSDIYVSGNEINKELISQKVFTDSFLLSQLNQIIHPYVKNQFEIWEGKNKQHKYIIKESALIFEAGLNKEMYKIILVNAPIETRIKRVIKRDKLDREIVLKKIANQISDNFKESLVDYYINNDDNHLIIPRVIEIRNAFGENY